MASCTNSGFSMILYVGVTGLLLSLRETDERFTGKIVSVPISDEALELCIISAILHWSLIIGITSVEHEMY